MFSSDMLNSFRRQCILLRVIQTPDGQGGSLSRWTEVTMLDAFFGRESSVKAVTAEKQDSTKTCSVYVQKSADICFQDVLRRVEDGLCYRVTSEQNDNRVPDTSAMDWRRIIVERWEMPSD